MAVLDGYCQGGGLDRATVMRRILREFELALGVAQRILRPVALAGLSSDGLWQRQARTQ